MWDTDVLRVRFLAAEFAAVEGFQPTATITIVRDFEYAQNELTVGYSTEDLTARGIDDDAWLGCSGGPVDSAPTTGCGDYVQTAGVTTFGKGEIAAFFYVNIVDDPCTESAEYVQLSISVPGAPALAGRAVHRAACASTTTTSRSWRARNSVLILDSRRTNSGLC